MNDSDEVLVQRSLKGDQEAFAVLVRRYQTLVCSVAYTITGNFARSEDVGQECLVKAWESLESLEDERKFKSWICSMARNLAHNSNRHYAKMPNSEAPQSYADPASSVEHEAIEAEEERLVWDTLQSLPEQYREPLVLFYRQGQSVAEVADSLELSADVVRQRLSRGRNQLRKDVASLIERALENSVPTKAFTVAVLAALPANTANAATASTAGVMATGAAKTATTGAILGPLIGVLGGMVGAWCSWSAARFQSQRDFIVKTSIVYLIGISVFSAPFIAMNFGWNPVQQFGQKGYLKLYLPWMGVFMLLNFVWIGLVIRGYQALEKQDSDSSEGELPQSQVQQFTSQFEGRRWQSATSLFGSPLVCVAFHDPGDNNGPFTPKHVARGWIAIGDFAVAKLLGIGNVVRAPIAIGNMACGVVAMGVMSFGAISIGVISGGVLSIGVLGLAVFGVGVAVVGYLANGVLAFGWQAAKGVVAFSFHHASGTTTFATNENVEASIEFFANSGFFRISGELMAQAMPWTSFPWIMIPVGILVATGVTLSRVGYKRKSGGTGENSPS